MAKTVATIMGVVFILAGLVGFVSNDLLGFHLTAFHNAGVHIVSGRKDCRRFNPKSTPHS